MPIYVQWDWQEKTKTFLVIFHFFDDFSDPNLRIKRQEKVFKVMRFKPECKAWMTWAPSHVELGLMGELLRYANIVDGLSECIKRKLRNLLESSPDDSVTLQLELMHRLPSSKHVFQEVGTALCVQLCQEYIDYLKEILKPYIR